MAHYKTCPVCGATLDFCEECDCNGEPQDKKYIPKRVMPAPAAKEKKRSKRKSSSRIRIPAKYRI